MLAGLSLSAEPWMHRKYGGLKARLFSNAESPILEIGAGGGGNFRYLPPNSVVHAVEPNVFCRKLLEDSAQEHAVDLRIHEAFAESIPLPDESIRTAICSLVLCTVTSPGSVIDEVFRCLKPDGRFLFIEHVAGSTFWLRSLQKLLQPGWSLALGGCRLCRDTARTLEQSSFNRLEISRVSPVPSWLPMSPHIVGSARKSA